MSKKTRETFSPEFKREAVRLLEESDKESAQLARELGVRRNQLYKWQKEIHQYGDQAFPGHGKRPREKRADEPAVLKAELKKLREENEILKKAARYFARESD
jgi:Transposase and inactivated derivatives